MSMIKDVVQSYKYDPADEYSNDLMKKVTACINNIEKDEKVWKQLDTMTINIGCSMLKCDKNSNRSEKIQGQMVTMSDKKIVLPSYTKSDSIVVLHNKTHDTTHYGISTNGGRTFSITPRLPLYVLIDIDALVMH